MRLNNVPIYAMYALLLFLFACGGTEKETRNEPAILKIQNSYNIWLEKKQELQNTYSYTMQQTDISTTHLRNWYSTIYVENGEIVCRYFQNIDDLSISVWMETAKKGDLGKHNEGIPLDTMDGVYGKCHHLAANDPGHRLLFTTNETGIVKSCYFSEFSEPPYPYYSKIQILSFNKNNCALNKLWEEG